MVQIVDLRTQRPMFEEFGLLELLAARRGPVGRSFVLILVFLNSKLTFYRQGLVLVRPIFGVILCPNEQPVVYTV